MKQGLNFERKFWE